MEDESDMSRSIVAVWAIVAVIVAACRAASTATPSVSTAAPTASAVVASQLVSPSPSPGAPSSASAAASPSGSATTFTSPFYAYTLTLPPGWIATPASKKWDGIGAPGDDNPAVDRFHGQGSGSMHAFAAPASLDLARYGADVIARIAQFHADTCPPKPDTVEALMVGTQPATFIAWNCGILINVVATVHNGTGYEFVFRDPDVHQATDDSDRATFDSILRTVSFER